MQHHTEESRLSRLEAWRHLARQAEKIAEPDNHLRYLIAEPDRLREFSRTGAGLFYDFSRQRVTSQIINLLLQLAEVQGVQEKFLAMTKGEMVNSTEKRAALHTAARDFSNPTINVNGLDVMEEINRVKAEIKQFTQEIDNGRITGSTGKLFAHIVVIGIGGSYLGTEFVARALQAKAIPGRHLHFLANVDIHNFGEVVAAIDPETTLWIVVSKSFTTAETMANATQAKTFMEQQGLDPAKHFVSVTSQGSPGDPSASGTSKTSPFPVLRSFHMFDFIGGRYSVTSAVGGVPLSLYLGYGQFEKFLKGAHEMDQHAQNALPEDNLPLLAALISIWNNNFLNYPAQAIIPYASPLAKLAPHVQQLYMESNGKAVTEDGIPVAERTGVMIFGEPGTNAQHSFFQLAHQGNNVFPIDFIGVVHPQYDNYPALSRGVTNHQELWANLISQPKALAEGKDDDADPHKNFTGNRPSSTIILKNLSPESVGGLLAFYEARTVYEAFIWDINPFDQFGVELGKTLATEVRNTLAEKNANPDQKRTSIDPITDAYLDMLNS